MAHVEMYSSWLCPYCVRARGLLRAKGVEVEEYEVGMDPEVRHRMIERSGRTSVPQIFVDREHVGGCDDLFALERAGRLDALLGLA